MYDGKPLGDPDPTQTVDEIRQSLVDFFPELSNATSTEKKTGDDTVITFTKRVGTKGAKVKVEVEILDGKDCWTCDTLCPFYWQDDDGGEGCGYLGTSREINEEPGSPKFEGCPNPEKK
jgi:PRTRC genetic system protein C